MNQPAEPTHCFEILEQNIFPYANMFCYGQVESIYGSGKFMSEIEEYFHENEILLTSLIPDRNAIYDSIKVFLGKGK